MNTNYFGKNKYREKGKAFWFGTPLLCIGFFYCCNENRLEPAHAPTSAFVLAAFFVSFVLNSYRLTLRDFPISSCFPISPSHQPSLPLLLLFLLPYLCPSSPSLPFLITPRLNTFDRHPSLCSIFHHFQSFHTALSLL